MSKHHSHDAPHESMVGALIALVVVSIVFEGIFLFGWIEILVKLILFFHLVKEIIQYVGMSKEQKAYRYHTTGEDVLHIWIAAIIVNVVLSLIFPYDPWWARIAPAVLNIKAVEITILYFVTRHQNRQAYEQHQIAASSNLYGQYHSDTKHQHQPVVKVVNTTDNSAMNTQTVVSNIDYEYEPSSRAEKTTPSFCPMCGARHDETDKFCPLCGANLRH